MPRSEALQCTIEEAIFYLSSDDRVKKACKQMNLRAEGIADAGDEMAAYRADMAARRKFYTGTDELKP